MWQKNTKNREVKKSKLKIKKGEGGKTDESKGLEWNRIRGERRKEKEKDEKKKRKKKRQEEKGERRK